MMVTEKQKALQVAEKDLTDARKLTHRGCSDEKRIARRALETAISECDVWQVRIDRRNGVQSQDDEIAFEGSEEKARAFCERKARAYFGRRMSPGCTYYLVAWDGENIHTLH